MFKNILSVALYLIICSSLLLGADLFVSINRFATLDPILHIIYMLIVYSVKFYLPFIIAFIITWFIAKSALVKYTTLCTYIVVTIYLFVNNQYWARGMEIENRVLYAMFLFTPALAGATLIFINSKYGLKVFINGSSKS
ncbi:MAG: hypothetical protein JNM78_14810 [Cyclobacteriaceae bacterium]|nr:hypothetical protein [Cyclobacteriaceae bacterium]